MKQNFLFEEKKKQKKKEASEPAPSPHRLINRLIKPRKK